MSKQFNNTSGTTSSEFGLGIGSLSARHIVLGVTCNGEDANAKDRAGNEIAIRGVEFYDLKMLAKDQLGNLATKQLRGTIVEGGNITRIEDIFEEMFNGDVELSLTGSTLNITCKIGSALQANYNIFVSLQRIS